MVFYIGGMWFCNSFHGKQNHNMLVILNILSFNGGLLETGHHVYPETIQISFNPQWIFPAYWNTDVHPIFLFTVSVQWWCYPINSKGTFAHCTLLLYCSLFPHIPHCMIITDWKDARLTSEFTLSQYMGESITYVFTDTVCTKNSSFSKWVKMIFMVHSESWVCA